MFGYHTLNTTVTIVRAVNNPWWLSMLFYRRGLAVVDLVGLMLHLVAAGGIMTTRKELPYPSTCSYQANFSEEGSRLTVCYKEVSKNQTR